MQICLFSRIFNKAILVSELYRLPKCIVPPKQSLSQPKNKWRDAFINAKKINVTFHKPLVNVSWRNFDFMQF